MRSMTGMGAGRARDGGVTVHAEIRSVNHRFLDLALRCPSSLSRFEPVVRERVAKALDRGRVTASLELERGAGAVRVVVDEEHLTAYLEAARAMALRHKLPGELDLAHVASLPEVFRVEEDAVDEKVLEGLIGRAVDQALERLDAMRSREGKALAKELRRRCAALSRHRKAVARHADELPALMRKRLEDRLAALGAKDAVEPQRLAQEVVLMAEKSTITEEMERLASHLEQFEETLQAEGPAAKRLGFLLQEMHREVNTIGSKSSLLVITDEVVRMKEEIENMREQIQNLE